MSDEWFCTVDRNDSISVSLNGVGGVDVELTEHGTHDGECSCGRSVSLSMEDVTRLSNALARLVFIS